MCYLACEADPEGTARATGYTRFVAENFSKKTDAECHSIEEDFDFGDAIARHERICFSYPIYGSCVPRIMEDFVRRHRSALIGKEFVILCTQLLFSGSDRKDLILSKIPMMALPLFENTFTAIVL